ncbi:hypothetical protein [Luteolibacter luteus]|uniref:Uncharacterized protein n=1 Tax=Luteolibacter luteus TaxID=2728835 RepID=A0A858RI21_9BACT|nr:hypothetical protein [Luteolibacter luteus]QJE95723.1 hypothetical protein HHL09_07965 [Luteolibacter luteus]
MIRLFKSSGIAVGFLGSAMGSTTSIGIYHQVGTSWLINPSNSEDELPQDTDGDGLTDSWEIQFFGNLRDQCGSDDPDGDGVNNAEEMAAGTSPTNRWD